MQRWRESDWPVAPRQVTAADAVLAPRFANDALSQVDVNLSAIAANARWIKARVGRDVRLMAVVKADGYGHGALQVAQAALAHGADALAVANLAEATALRQGGVNAPILLLSYVPPAAIPRAIALGLSVTIFDCALAGDYQAAAESVGGRLPVHVKVDSGMGRLGISLADTAQLCQQLDAMSQLDLAGMYTHFSSADADLEYTRLQLRRFEQVLAAVSATGIRLKFVHAANSAALLTCPGSHFNMARPGLLLYGLNPLPARGAVDGLRPALSWRTLIAQVKTLPPGSPVGYGKSYYTRAVEKIAVLPVGYADGLRRSPRTWREVLVRGRRAPLVGRVSMEKATIDVSHIPGVKIGDEVILLGAQGDDEISADEVASWLGSINYEVVTSLAPRTPRTYQPS